MKLSHPVSWILTSFACGILCANDEAQLGSDVIEKVQGAIRDGGAQEIIASVSFLLNVGVIQKALHEITEFWS